jgi:hypothetical protein
VKLEGVPLDLDVVFPTDPIDPIQGDVAVRSDEVGEDG